MGEVGLQLDAVEDQALPAIVGGGRVARSNGDHRVVMGCNHDVLYQSRIFHVQSEDSGRRKRRIYTHVFCSGVIVASNRVDYEECAERARVIELLRMSHQSMMRKLVRGTLDEAISHCLGRSPADEPASSVEASANDLDPRGRGHERIRRLREDLDMSNISKVIENIRSEVAGTLGVALVDYESGMCLGSMGVGIDVDVAAAGNTEVMKAKTRVMRDLGIEGGIEDILITLDSQYHIIRPVGSALFLYLAIDRRQGNLALARHKLGVAAEALEV